MGSSVAGTGHASAVRRARQVEAHRAEKLREREQAVTATLVEFFEAKDRADKIRADAQARAARLLQTAQEKAARLAEQAREAGQQVIENAEKDASNDDAQVGTAIRHLRELGEAASAVAEMTGLSQALVRAVEREHLPPHEPGPHSKARGSASKSRARPDPMPE
jgi:F0F1-type ATP synthase membrane subunit b/b'